MTKSRLSFKGMSEKAFATEFELIAQKMRCLWVDIPDMIPTRDRIERKIREKRRPADGILVTPYGLALIELKAQHNTALRHQKECSWKSRMVNPAAYFFVRRVDKPNLPTVYQLLELDGTVITVDPSKLRWQKTLETPRLETLISQIMRKMEAVNA